MLKIALTNLRKYNKGELDCEWVNLPCDDLDVIIDRFGDDEYFISDYECEKFNVDIHEYEDLEKLNELAEELENLNDFEKIVLRAIIEADGIFIYEALDILKDESYIFYETDDFDEFIDAQIDSGFFGYITDEVRGFLDYEKLKNYFEDNGYMMTSVGVMFTF